VLPLCCCSITCSCRWVYAGSNINEEDIQEFDEKGKDEEGVKRQG
jgi:hypothetical protein